MLKLRWLLQGLIAVVLFFGLIFSSSTAAPLSVLESFPAETESVILIPIMVDSPSVGYDEQAEIAAVNERYDMIRTKMAEQMAHTALVKADEEIIEDETTIATITEPSNEIAVEYVAAAPVSESVAVASQETEQESVPVVQNVAEPIKVEEAPVAAAVVAAPSHYMVAPGVGFVGSDMRAMSYTPWYPNWEPARNANEYSADVQWFIDQGHIGMAGRPQDNYDGYPTMLIGHSGSGMSHLAPWINYGSVLNVGDINGTYRQYEVIDILANPASTAYATFANGVDNGDVFYWGIGGGEAVVISLCQGSENYYYYAVPIN